MATFCDIPNCQYTSFRTDKKTSKHYCGNHWRQYSTDIDKRSITQKAMAKGKPRKPGFFELAEKGGEMDGLGAIQPVSGGKGNIALQRWFEDRHKELTGRCSHCGGKSSKGDPKYWKYSIAHLLPKSLFPSIATHPKNFLELCYFAPSCHTNYDQNSLDLIELNCFDEAVMKFVEMYPFIDKKERRKIPELLLQYVEIEK